MLGLMLGFLDMYCSVIWVSFVVFLREKLFFSFGFMNLWILFRFSNGCIDVCVLMSVCVELVKNIG